MGAVRSESGCPASLDMVGVDFSSSQVFFVLGHVESVSVYHNREPLLFFSVLACSCQCVPCGGREVLWSNCLWFMSFSV